MREIKFRAWDEQNKIMHQDFQFIKSGESGNDWIVFTSDKQTLQDPTHPFENPYFGQQLKIMQFTGLKDKSGNEIYEGDIVPMKIGVQNYGQWNVEDPNATLNGVFKWNEHQLCWIISYKHPNKYDLLSSSLGWYNSPEFEVIGNIYQNPELLK